MKYTPMMEQFLEIKRANPDVLIFFRLGDFYELFFDDAKVASRELQLLLTGKNAGASEKVPMCGIPHHAANSYIQKLVLRGYKVGICEQLEDPKLTKDLVKRGLIQIYTPGANLDFKETGNNYIGALTKTTNYFILAYADITTGEVILTNVSLSLCDLFAEIDNLNLKEIVVSTSFEAATIQSIIQKRKVLFSYENNDLPTIEHDFLLKNVKDEESMKTLARLYNYLKRTQCRDLSYLEAASVTLTNKTLIIDSYSRSNLELTKTIRNNEVFGSLLWLLDDTCTHMGSRLLSKWIIEPSASLPDILKRQTMVENLMSNYSVRNELSLALKDIYDLERLISRVNFGTTSGRDLVQLKKSLVKVPLIKKELALLNLQDFNYLSSKMADFSSLVKLLNDALLEDPPVTIKEGKIFKVGFNKELDELILLSTNSKQWVVELETRERERTGIKNLKVGFTRVFGYYIEVSNGQTNQVKEEFGYIRKQTLVNCERYITEELKNEESKILNAEENRMKLEYELFLELRNRVMTETSKIQELAKAVAEVDCLLTLASISLKNHYVKPQFSEGREIDIIGARHPVIEKVMPLMTFVPNDFKMSHETDVLIITGPNMGGKSTYMRELAIIVILAQMGSFVPCEKATLPLFDRIFTRIGASDDLVSGQSTFMVEMTETNNALRKATSNSLLLFDEIGRGTATYDGMALAQAILEYIVSKIHAKTLFSTHYHELTSLEGKVGGLRNVHVAVSEVGDEITFLYKVVDGAMDKSYGINVARLASLPPSLLSRASEILLGLEKDKVKIKGKVFKEEPIKKEATWVQELRCINPLELSPLDALNFIFKIKQEMER